MLSKFSKIDITPNRRLFAILSSLVVVLFGLLVSRVVGNDEMFAFYFVIGVAIFFFAFVNTDFALSVLILSMLLSPEFTLGGAGGTETHSQRNVVLRVDDLVLGLITVSWFIRTAVNKDLGIFIQTPLNRPLFGYWLAGLFATILGIFMGSVRPLIGLLYNVKYLQYYMIFFMASSHVRDLKTMRRYLILILITGIVVSFYGLWQIPTGARVSAPFEGEEGEANTLGGYLVFVIAIIFGVMTEEKKLNRLLVLGGLILIMFVPFLYTLSRSSWISIIPVFIAILVFSPQRVAIIRIVVPILFIVPFLLPGAVYERIEYTFSEDHSLRTDIVEVGDTALDPSTSARISSWTTTIEQWSERPLFGWGVTGAGFKDAEYFRVLAETGVFGLFFFLWLLYSIHRMTRDRIKSINREKHPYLYGMLIGYYAGFLGLLTHAIGANTFIIVRIMEPFWFMTALVVMLPSIMEHKESESEDEERLPATEYIRTLPEN